MTGATATDPPGTLTGADVDNIQRILTDTYTDTDLRPVLVADGYAVSLSVRNRQLVIRDGTGTHRRTRTLPRAQRTVTRIVVTGDAGTITLGALKWCHDAGVSVVHVDRNGDVLATGNAGTHTDARILRAQAGAQTSDVGLSIARHLLTAKIAGHAAVADAELAAPTTAANLRRITEALDSVAGLAELVDLEAHAADLYYTAWIGVVSATFARTDARRVPEHWHMFTGRRSPLDGRSARKAADPVNAVLNYAYALAETECRRACLALGVEPSLGIVHRDNRGRNSMALDLLETIRPVVERNVLAMFRIRRFRYVDFAETTDGQCRLTASITRPLADHLPVWAAAVAPHAEHVAHALSDAATGKIRKRTPLTQANHTPPTARRRRTAPRAPATVATCTGCGEPVPTGRTWCTRCWAPHRRALATERAKNAGRARQQSGTDPSQTTEARAARSASLAANRAERDTWDRAHPDAVHDPVAFTRDVIPGLSGVPLSAIQRATGLSDSAASRIRSGKLTPHPRHWEKLAALVPTEPGGR